MMNKKKLIEILTELKERSRDYKDGFFAPEVCRIKISELKNYDFFIFTELEKIEKELWRKKNNNSDKTQVNYASILKIENDYVNFIPQIVRTYLKEIDV